MWRAGLSVFTQPRPQPAIHRPTEKPEEPILLSFAVHGQRLGAQTLNLKGDETIDIVGLDDIRPQQALTLVVKRPNGSPQEVKVKSRIDTAIEVDYYRHGGILPYVLRELTSKAGPSKAKAA